MIYKNGIYTTLTENQILKNSACINRQKCINYVTIILTCGNLKQPPVNQHETILPQLLLTGK
jgi:hypothetical protein